MNMDEQHFAQLVDEHADGLYRFALSMLNEEAAAEDAVQDAFEGLWRNRKRVDLAKSKSYLFTSVHNHCIDAIRRHRPKIEAETAQLVSPEAAPHDLQTHLHQGLATLPDKQQSMILLRDYEGYSYAEIADITHSTLETVKVSIFRARRTLRAFLGSIENVR
jgi:RNA polymerase sigma-70 factor (ECF subfamily)